MICLKSFARWLMPIFLLSCGQSNDMSTLKEGWDGANDPDLIGNQYNFRLAELPSSGSSNDSRWTGDYWPSSRGGIAQRWLNGGNLAQIAGAPLPTREELNRIDLKALSPAEKYDLFAGDFNFTLTKRERTRTQVLATIPGNSAFRPGFSIPAWEGLCHGWAPASINYKEPKPVTLSSSTGLKIPFGSADIKALLSFAMHEGINSSTQFLGRRCEADFGQLRNDLASGRISQQQYDAQVKSLECRDTNAGSFHIVLANEIGKRQKSFVIDITADREVWNQGVVSYESRLGSIKQQRSPGAHPSTVKEVDVETKLVYITEIDSNWDAQGGNAPGMLAPIVFNYRLELDGAGEVVGGAWLSERKPDFMWRQSRASVSQQLAHLPSIYQAATGDKFGGSNATPPSPGTIPTPPPPGSRPGHPGSGLPCNPHHPACRF